MKQIAGDDWFVTSLLRNAASSPSTIGLGFFSPLLSSTRSRTVTWSASGSMTSWPSSVPCWPGSLVSVMPDCSTQTFSLTVPRRHPVWPSDSLPSIWRTVWPSAEATWSHAT
jgi:hypothetical protein